MSLPPVAARALALLDDQIDRGLRGLQVRDRDELRPAEQLGRGLGVRGADEHRALPQPVAQGAQPLLQAPVQVPDGLVLLAARHELGRVEAGAGGRDRPERLGVLQLHALGPLQVEEVAQRLLAEGQQVELDAGGEVAGALREVRPAERGGGTDGGQQVGDQRQVQHLLHRDGAQHPAPSGDGLGLLVGEPLLRPALQAGLGEEILAQDHVFQLGGLVEQPPQVFPVRDHDRGLDRWLGHRRILLSRAGARRGSAPGRPRRASAPR